MISKKLSNGLKNYSTLKYIMKLDTRTPHSQLRKSDDSDEEKDLTNLNWLLRNQNITWLNPFNLTLEEKGVIQHDVASSTCLEKEDNEEINKNSKQENTKIKMNLNTQISAKIKRPTPTERFETFLNKIKRNFTEYEKFAAIYKTNETDKPPFNYSHIIGMAMLEKGRVTLQQICSWIESKFAFFRVRKKWNNSIRHNLSLHHCFRKIDRKREERGKGGYWELGVDLRKCDRKRIRNRKSSITRKRMCPDTCLVKTNTLPQKANYLKENDNLNELSSSENISNIATEEGNNSPINLNNYSLSPKITQPKSLDWQSQLELGTVIITTAFSKNDAPTENCLMDDIYHNQNELYCEEEVPLAGEDIIVSSYQVNWQNKINNISTHIHTHNDVGYYSLDALDAYKSYAPHMFLPISTSNKLLLNSDISNFRQALDGVDDACKYIPNLEINRNEDYLDNLLDICVKDY